MTSTTFYRLDANNEALPVHWEQFRQTVARRESWIVRIAKTRTRHHVISTIFTGVDMRTSEGEAAAPLLFETMVTEADTGEFVSLDRTSTYRAAEDMHAQCVAYHRPYTYADDPSILMGLAVLLTCGVIAFCVGLYVSDLRYLLGGCAMIAVCGYGIITAGEER